MKLTEKLAVSRIGLKKLSLFYLPLLIVPSWGQSPVSLSNISPDSYRVGDSVTLTVSRIPAGAVNPAATVVELAPRDSGVGPVVTVFADTVTALPVGTDRLLKFRIPAALRNSLPYSVRLSIRGIAGTTAFASAAPRVLNVFPDAKLSSVSPAGASRGQSVSLEIRGKYTQFAANTVTGVSFDGTGVSVASYTVDGPNQIIRANVTIDAAAATGPRALRVNLLGGGQLQLADAFFIFASPAKTLTIANPSFCNPGDTNLQIQITGSGTSFTSAPSAVYMGDGVVVNSVTAPSDTVLNARISCDRLAFPGTRDLTVVTGAQFAMGSNLFTVNSSGAAFSAITPAVGIQGQTITNLLINATQSAFRDGATTVSLTRSGASPLTVGSITRLSDTQLRVELAIASNSAPGDYDLRIQTGGELISAPAVFRVNAGSPEIISFTPSGAVQGTTATVRVTARFFSFIQGTTTADFGSGITVNTAGITTTPSPSGPQIQIPITIAPTAALGGRTVTLSTGSTILSFPLNVTASAVSLSVLNPNVGFQGQSLLRVNLTGTGTSFVQGTTSVTLANPLKITRIEVTSPTALNFDLYIPPYAPVATNYSLSVQTGGEIAASPNAFQVLPATPVISLTPNFLSQGSSGTIVITGQFTNFNASSLVAINPSDDLTLGPIQLVSASEIRIPVTVGALANLPPIPNRTLSVATTVPSPLGNYLESLDASFSPIPGPALVDHAKFREPRRHDHRQSHGQRQQFHLWLFPPLHLCHGPDQPHYRTRSLDG